MSRAGFNGLDPLRSPPFFLAAWQFLFGRRQKEQIPITASQRGGGEPSLNTTQRAAVASALSGARRGVPPSSVPQKGTFLRVTGTPACAQPRRPSQPLQVLKGLSVHGAAHRKVSAACRARHDDTSRWNFHLAEFSWSRSS